LGAPIALVGFAFVLGVTLYQGGGVMSAILLGICGAFPGAVVIGWRRPIRIRAFNADRIGFEFRNPQSAEAFAKANE
jgi:hypothetical protein